MLLCKHSLQYGSQECLYINHHPVFVRKQLLLKHLVLAQFTTVPFKPLSDQYFRRSRRFSKFKIKLKLNVYFLSLLLRQKCVSNFLEKPQLK